LEAQEYEKLVKALRCKRDDCEGCDLAFFDKDEGWMCRYAAKDDDAADAIEAAEQRIAELEKELEIWTARSFEGKIGSMALINLNLRMEISKLEAQLPKRGEWLIHSTGGSMATKKCPFCGSESWQSKEYAKVPKYCQNCGAHLPTFKIMDWVDYLYAKTEVQE
jgi:hypothetical protein